jgi:hypothetical protein
VGSQIGGPAAGAACLSDPSLRHEGVPGAIYGRTAIVAAIEIAKEVGAVLSHAAVGIATTKRGCQRAARGYDPASSHFLAIGGGAGSPSLLPAMLLSPKLCTAPPPPAAQLNELLKCAAHHTRLRVSPRACSLGNNGPADVTVGSRSSKGDERSSHQGEIR